MSTIRATRPSPLSSSLVPRRSAPGSRQSSRPRNRLSRGAGGPGSAAGDTAEVVACIMLVASLLVAGGSRTARTRELPSPLQGRHGAHIAYRGACLTRGPRSGLLRRSAPGERRCAAGLKRLGKQVESAGRHPIGGEGGAPGGVDVGQRRPQPPAHTCRFDALLQQVSDPDSGAFAAPVPGVVGQALGARAGPATAGSRRPGAST